MANLPAFPKPGQVRKVKPWKKEFPDGRVIFDTATKQGREAYRENTRIAYERQGKKCGLMITPQCQGRKGRWSFDYMQLDHSFGRGMGGGKRDDRVVNDKGEPSNLCVCPFCNIEKGSRPITDFNEVVP